MRRGGSPRAVQVVALIAFAAWAWTLIRIFA